MTPAQARAAAAVVEVRARDVPSLKAVARALWEWAEENEVVKADSPQSTGSSTETHANPQDFRPFPRPALGG